LKLVTNIALRIVKYIITGIAIIIILRLAGIVWCMDHMGDLDSDNEENIEESDDSISSENDTRTPNELLNVTESFETIMGEQLRRLQNTKG